MIKIFFRTLRLFLTPFMLLWAKLATPKGIIRADQPATDQQCAQLKLYHFKTCPFCIKVRHEMARLSLPVAMLDAQHDPVHRAHLEQGGGKIQAPCLRITDANGKVEWLYESRAIISYLQQRFNVAA